MPFTERENIPEGGRCRADCWWLAAILCLALGLRLAVYWLGPQEHHPPFSSDAGTYFGYAQSIADGQLFNRGFAREDARGRMPRLSLPPLYPVFLSLFLATIGFVPGVVFGIQIALSVASV